MRRLDLSYPPILPPETTKLIPTPLPWHRIWKFSYKRKGWCQLKIQMKDLMWRSANKNEQFPFWDNICIIASLLIIMGPPSFWSQPPNIAVPRQKSRKIPILLLASLNKGLRSSLIQTIIWIQFIGEWKDIWWESKSICWWKIKSTFACVEWKRYSSVDVKPVHLLPATNLEMILSPAFTKYWSKATHLEIYSHPETYFLFFKISMFGWKYTFTRSLHCWCSSVWLPHCCTLHCALNAMQI